MSDPTPTDNCNGCEQDYEINKETANLIIYIISPEMKHLATVCPHCKFQTRIFVTDEDAIKLILVVKVFVHGSPTDSVIRGFRKVNDIPELAEDVPQTCYEIPPSLEREIGRWHNALEDPHFTDEAELPAPNSNLPQKWRGEDNRPGAST